MRATKDEREPFMIVPIEQVDVVAAVQAKLLELIDARGLAAGEKLPAERELATQLNVSRAAVREALKVLQATGRVRIVHGSGTYVDEAAVDPIANVLRPQGGPTPAYLQNLAEVRAAIEVRVAELAARSATPADVKGVEALLEGLGEDQAENPESGTLSVAFEFALSEIARNPLLATLQSSLDRLWVEAWGALHAAPGSRARLHAEHVEIFEAVRRNDPAEASRLMRSHLDRDVGWPAGVSTSEVVGE